MSSTIPNSFQVKFKNNVETRLQLKKDPLEGTMMEQFDTGAEKVKVKDLVGAAEAKEAEGRNGKTEWTETDFDGVWIPKPNELYDADIIDNADQLATAISLKGAGTKRGAETITRARVRRRLEGFYGPIISGKSGTVTTAFPSGQIIPVTTGGASGAQKMNVKKLREANKLLGADHVDMEMDRYMILTVDDNDALLSEVPATSSDFKTSFAARLDDKGRLLSMLGWTFIHLELDNAKLTTIPDLATDASGYRKTPFWTEGGMCVNWWQKLRPHVGLIPERLFNEGWFVGTTLGATRTQAEMSGIILNQKG
ncbi:phage capsid protein [Aurantiacibacter zhengii]|nr:phage capsid protein [Aurantiacibacter zhengii]